MYATFYAKAAQNLPGFSQFFKSPISTASKKFPAPNIELITASVSEVAKKLEKNSANLKTSVKEIQQIINLTGRKIHFSVNKELGNVVISVVDSDTNKVVRKIPSEAMQKLHETLKITMGDNFTKI